MEVVLQITETGLSGTGNTMAYSYSDDANNYLFLSPLETAKALFAKYQPQERGMATLYFTYPTLDSGKEVVWDTAILTAE